MAKYMTLLAGGKQQTLANGLPLYGKSQTEGLTPVPLERLNPIIRRTSTRIDRVGNLLACNNWKPSAFHRCLPQEPRRGGRVIFVGAPAPELRS